MSRRKTSARNRGLAAQLRLLDAPSLRQLWRDADEQMRELQGARQIIWRELRVREREARRSEA